MLPGNLCVAGVIQVDEIESKTTGNIIITGNLHPGEDRKYNMGTLTNKWNHIVTQDITVCGTITANIMNNTTDSNTIIANIICVTNELRVDNIVEKTPGHGVIIDGVSILDSNIVADTITANKFIGNLCGNVIAKNIDVDNITINNDLIVSNLIADTVTADKFIGNLCGNVEAKNIDVDNITINNDLILPGNLCVDGVIQVDEIESKTSGNILIDGNLIPKGMMNTLGTLNQKWDKIYVQDIIICGNITGNVVTEECKAVHLSTGVGSIACNSKYVGSGTTSKKFVDVAIVAQNDITFKSITFTTIGTGGTFANATATLYTRIPSGSPTPTSLVATVLDFPTEFNMAMGNVEISKGDTYSVKVNPGGGSNMSAAITLEYCLTL
jgi:hypothetical protein